MSGVVLPPLKLSLMYKCRGCGHKFRPLFTFMPGKCPHCGGENLKLSVDLIRKPPGPIVY